MPSEFERGLLPNLRELIPDLTAERALDGRGKRWVTNLHSESKKVVIEACSRNVVRTGKSKSSIQHYEKFHSMLLKLIDIKAKDPSIRPVMIWRSLIPAYSTDLRLSTVWGIFVMSNENLQVRQILSGDTPGSVNKRALPYLIRKSENLKPRWRWLVEDRRRAIVEMLKVKAMGIKEIEGALGITHTYRSSPLSETLRELVRTGTVFRLSRGYVRGFGAVYGVDPKQFEQFERIHFDAYRLHKRKDRVADRILQLLKEEGPMGYRQIMGRLEKRWGIQATRESTVSLLARRLRKNGLVHASGPPKGLVYSMS